MTQSTPRISGSTAPTRTGVDADLDSWLEHVERGSRGRARVELLISAKGLLKPVTLAQRFVIKTRQVGFRAAVGVVVERLRPRRPAR